MPRLLVTGMSGVGKTSLLGVLNARGYVTVDTDYDGWVLADGRWDKSRMARLLASHTDVVVSGTVDNQGDFYDRFEHVVLLSAPLEVLLERLQQRATNSYGKSAEERAEVVAYVKSVQPLLRAGASLELDARRPIEELADTVEDLLA